MNKGAYAPFLKNITKNYILAISLNPIISNNNNYPIQHKKEVNSS